MKRKENRDDLFKKEISESKRYITFCPTKTLYQAKCELCSKLGLPAETQELAAKIAGIVTIVMRSGTPLVHACQDCRSAIAIMKFGIFEAKR